MHQYVYYLFIWVSYILELKIKFILDEYLLYNILKSNNILIFIYLNKFKTYPNKSSNL